VTSLSGLKPLAVVRAFERAGWTRRRLPRKHGQGGSHVYLISEGNPYVLAVPVHKGRDVRAGLLASLLKKAGLSAEEFLKLYKG
jgi:predicted RNA binding protein YcfA (HicA-like mRNA interferase family)